jgi:hypothetical protein
METNDAGHPNSCRLYHNVNKLDLSSSKHDPIVLTVLEVHIYIAQKLKSSPASMNLSNRFKGLNDLQYRGFAQIWIQKTLL